MSSNKPCELGDKCGIINEPKNPSECWCITCTSLGTISWVYCHKCKRICDYYASPRRIIYEKTEK